MTVVQSTSTHPAAERTQRNAASLRTLMDFYASDDDRDLEEGETDLMVQLSGIVGERIECDERA